MIFNQADVPVLATPLTERPRLAIALGDPAGIGTEVALKALNESTLTKTCAVTLVGNQQVLQQTYQQLIHRAGVPEAELASPDRFDHLDVPLESAIVDQIRLGDGNAASGAASFRYLETAIAHTLAGEFQGIVTAPIAKSAWKAAGHAYPGQTELLAEKAGVERFGMLFVARSPHTDWILRTLLATTHIPLRHVPDRLSAEGMTLKLGLLIDCLHQDFGIDQPRIAIAGLNPHSGEQGNLGQEEQEWLIPWIEQMRDRFPQAVLDGPVPPDTLWVRPGQAWFGSTPTRHVHHAYLALYHDQGLIPVKLLAFDQAVNTTIGLPFVRTSPDHGTAFDIAGRGIASAKSFAAALRLASELVHQRHQVNLRKI